MKTYLIRNPKAKLGYELKIVNDDGTTIFQPIKGFAKDGSIHLDPSNPSGREWVTKAKMDKAGNELELLPHEKRAQGTTKTGTSTPSKSWVEYLTKDEKKILEKLKDKAMARKKADDIKAKIAALQALLPKEDK